ncbi:unnamed protein product [Arctogadus glacialis]
MCLFCVVHVPKDHRGRRGGEFHHHGFDHLPYHKLMGTVILLAYCLALLGSTTNICVISTDRRLPRPMYLLICNLAPGGHHVHTPVPVPP